MFYQYEVLLCIHEIVRPHLLFFDESYDEQLYSKHTVCDLCRVADDIIVIGNSLKNGLPAGIVGNAIFKNTLIIEINTSPEIEVGRTLVLKMTAEKAIPTIC
jgi:NAD-dependent SIR2 family protein deacetylase